MQINGVFYAQSCGLFAFSWLSSHRRFHLVVELSTLSLGCRAIDTSPLLSSYRRFHLVVELSMLLLGCRLSTFSFDCRRTEVISI